MLGLDYKRRSSKLQSVLQRLAADFVQRESDGKSIITITNIDLTSDGKQARLFFTVLPVEFESKVLYFSKSKRSDLRDFVKGKWKMNPLPFFDFEVDKGEKTRQHIDELLSSVNTGGPSENRTRE